MNATERFDALAAVLAYPGEGYAGRLDRCTQALGETGPEEARRLFGLYFEAARGVPVEQLQEDYTRTFDLDPSCSLEVGWHLFGENYSRGEFLVSMRRALRENGLEESGELPDHLVHVLPVLIRMERGKSGLFVSVSLAPALNKMLEAMGGRGGRYEDLLKAVRAVVLDHGVAVAKEAVRG